MTNPDNVGGLIEQWRAKARTCAKIGDHQEAGVYRTCAFQLGQLCRAAPAGGECSMGVGCAQAGKCYAKENGRPEMCDAPAGGDVAACARKLLAEVMHADALGDLPDQVHGSTMFALAQSLDSAPAGSGEVVALRERFSPDLEPLSDLESWVAFMRPDPKGEWVRYTAAFPADADALITDLMDAADGGTGSVYTTSELCGMAAALLRKLQQGAE